MRITRKQADGADLQKLLRDLSPGKKGRWALVWAWLTNSAFREARKAALELRTAGKTSAQQLFAELTAAEEQRRKWRELSAGATQPQDVPNCLRHRQTFDSLVAEIADLETLVFRKSLEDSGLEGPGPYLEALRKDSVTPRRLPRLSEIESELEKAGVEKMLAEIRTKRPTPEKWASLFDSAWFLSCLDAAFAEDSEIAGFNGRTHDEFVKEFTELDKERVRIAAARVRRACGERAISVMNQHPEQDYLVRAEAQKKRRHLPLRKLFAQAQDVLTAVCPCRNLL